MATSNHIKQGAIGATVQVTVTKNGATWDLTSATVTAKIEKPSGETATWTMTVSSAAGGVVTYTTTTATDLDEAGKYKIEPKVVQGSLNIKADTTEFYIAAAL